MLINKSQILAFLFGILWAWQLEIVGVIYLAEILAIIALPFIILSNKLFSGSLLRAITISYLAILLGLIMADVYNGSDPRDYLRGWATPIVGYASLIFVFSFVTRNLKSVYGLLIGLIIARLISSEVPLENDVFLDNPNYFKARLAPSILMAVAILSSIIGRYSVKVAVAVLVVAGIVFILLGARSAGLILLFSSFFFIARTWLLSKSIVTKGVVIVMMLGLFQSLYIVYVNDVLANPDNSNSFAQLSRLDNPYNPLNLIVSGRTDVFVAFIAVQEQPIIGLGSWAGDPYGRYSELFFELKDANVTAYWSFIRSHSILMTAWLWGGILGLSGAAFLAWTVLKCFLQVSRRNEETVILAVILGIGFFWNFFFSPFGHIRTSVPFALGIMLAHVQKPLTRSNERKLSNRIRYLEVVK